MSQAVISLTPLQLEGNQSATNRAASPDHELPSLEQNIATLPTYQSPILASIPPEITEANTICEVTSVNNDNDSTLLPNMITEASAISEVASNINHNNRRV